MAESGGILTQSLWKAYHIFTKLREIRMNFGDFNDHSYFDRFAYFQVGRNPMLAIVYACQRTYT